MNVNPHILQVSLLGIIWVSFHCGGMCGPIMASLTSQTDSSRESPWKAAATVLIYQTGRAVTYLLLGLLAGALGKSLSDSVNFVGGSLAVGMGCMFFIYGSVRIGLQLKSGTTRSEQMGDIGQFFYRILSDVLRYLPQSWLIRTFIFGGLMGFLPCMLTFWVLGMAASTGSPIDAAGMMIWLVLITTPVLLAAGLTPFTFGRIFDWELAYLPETALVVSGLWLFLIGSASNGWIQHLHFGFEVFGQGFTVMLW